MTIASDDPTAIGPLLRTWRRRRRLSQLELSHRAGVSARHLSFMETGRARPTRLMIERLAERLDVPARQRNELLLAGGYAPRHDARSVDDRSLATVMNGLRQLLDAHLPNPALLLDDYWDIIDSNRAVELLLTGCEPDLLEPPVNAIRVSLHPGGLAPRIRNLEEWATHLLHQVDHRAAFTYDPRLRELAAEARSYVDVGEPSLPPTADPVIALQLDSEVGSLSFFSIAARITTATDATLAGLHLETFLPADPATAERIATADGG